jgi:hypothetical protein
MYCKNLSDLTFESGSQFSTLGESAFRGVSIPSIDLLAFIRSDSFRVLLQGLHSPFQFDMGRRLSGFRSSPVRVHAVFIT